MVTTLKKGHIFLIYAVLALATFIAFAPVLHSKFVNYDDDEYVTENSHVNGGISSKSVVWAFTTLHGDTSYWHPLTWLSHMLDCSLYGLNSGMHHLTNLFFHIINTLLLFWVLRRMTGAVWPSAFVAAAFALHPLHVESVAWVAERKDLLSAFFWLLTMCVYVRYTERPGIGRYFAVVLIFSFALMSKPMAVTLPFALLLLDYWPLERFQTLNLKRLRELVVEKIPLFVLSAILSVVAFAGQKSIGAVAGEKFLPLVARISNAFVSYTNYISKMVWPTRLAILYPHPGNSLPMWQVGISFLILVIVTIAIIRQSKRQRYLIVGWFWYLGVLVPAIGLIQVGAQAMADRYTYLSLIGLFIIIAWGAAEFTAKWRNRKITIGIPAILLLVVMLVCTRMQVRHWRDNFSLFSHALSVTENNYIMQNNFGSFLLESNQYDEALVHFDESLRINPKHVSAHINAGSTFLERGQIDKAVVHLNEAMKIGPNIAKIYNEFGIVYGMQGKFELAIENFEKAIELNPNLNEAILNLRTAQRRLLESKSDTVD